MRTFLLIALAFFVGYFVHRLPELKDNFPLSVPEENQKSSFSSENEKNLDKQVDYGFEDASLVRRNNSMVQAIDKASRSVVFIGVTQIKVVNNPFYDDPFFRQFFPPAVNEYRSMGSGVILTDKGHIVTNYHVIENASSIEVHLADGRQYKATLLGADLYTDLAIIKIEDKGLPAIKVVPNDSLYIGEWAVAIGNPFGALIKDNRPTVTTGVISAYGREFTRESGIKYNNMIQTDAAINPGNSGGALVNCFGELIGINTFIISPSGQGNIGLGFAIPASRAMKTLKEILQYGKIRSFYTGISIQNLTPYIAGSLGLKSTRGVIVNNVEKKSPGERAGLEVGDVIIKANNSEIVDQYSITDIFNQFLPGDEVLLSVIRKGKEVKLTLVLEGTK
jgi:serine protease Do